MIRLARFLAPVLSLVAVISCGSTTRGESFRIEPFPFVSQEPKHCGPACLAMILNHYGAAFSQEQLARETYREELGGTLNLELALAARRHGFEAVTRQGNIPALLEAVKQGTPVIVQVFPSSGEATGHFMVVYGYDREGRTLLVNSGRRQALVVPWEEFVPGWERAHSWMLEIKQRSSWP